MVESLDYNYRYNEPKTDGIYDIALNYHVNDEELEYRCTYRVPYYAKRPSYELIIIKCGSVL